MSTGDTILVLGAAGQIGTDLVTTLRETYGGDRVIATDVKEQTGYLAESGPFYVLDVLDAQAVADGGDQRQGARRHQQAAKGPQEGPVEETACFGQDILVAGHLLRRLDRHPVGFQGAPVEKEHRPVGNQAKFLQLFGVAGLSHQHEAGNVEGNTFFSFDF